MSDRDDAYVLAVDLGTSGPKVGLVSLSGRILEWRFERVPLMLLPGGGAEQDPADWWEAIVTATRHVLAESELDPGRIIAVACTGQWSGTVPVDGSGRHVGNAMIWMDSRGARLIADTISGPVRVEGYDVRKAARWIRLTGGAPGKSGKDPVSHILWLRHNRPDVYAATEVFLEPKDYLNLRLTGTAAAGFDSIALHWVTDNRVANAVRYDPRLIELSGLEAAKLPELRPAASVLGPILPAVAEELGVLPGTPVVMGTPDMHSAAIGAGATADGVGHLYLGTSSWLLCHVPYKKTDLIHNMASLPAAIDDRWLVANEQETAGACLTYLADNLLFYPDELTTDPTVGNVYEAFDRVAERVPAGNSGVIFTPWLYGERTPVEDATVRSGFFNQSLDTTREDLIKAVFEGVAYNSRWLLKYVERFTKRRLDDIRIVGGGAKSDIWCQIHADVLGRTVHRVADPILVNLRGVALLAGVSLGRVRTSDIPGLVDITDTYLPDRADTATYDRLFAEFVHIYKANRAIHARLNRR